MRPNKKSNLNLFLHRTLTFIVIVLFVITPIPRAAFAQFQGGPFGGDEESSLGGDIFSGGSDTGSSSGQSSSGSLAHGAATKLVFTVIPSATKHSFPFARQPIVEIRDGQ